jgi:hypothetical protein
MMKVNLTKRQVNALTWVLNQVVDEVCLRAPDLTLKDAKEESGDIERLLDLLDAAGRNTSEMRGRMPDLDAIFKTPRRA